MRNILQNRFAVLGIVIVAAIAIAIGLNMPKHQPRPTPEPDPVAALDAPCDPNATPDNCRIKEMIKKMKAQPWDRFDNKRISSSIDESSELTTDQKTTLKGLLASAYINTLKDTVQTYVIKADGYNGGQVADFRAELQALPTGGYVDRVRTEQLSLLDQFAAAWGLPGQIRNYLTTKRYDSDANNSYLRQIAGYESGPFAGNKRLIGPLQGLKADLKGFPAVHTNCAGMSPDDANSYSDQQLQRMSHGNTYYRDMLRNLKNDAAAKSTVE